MFVHMHANVSVQLSSVYLILPSGRAAFSHTNLWIFADDRNAKRNKMPILGSGRLTGQKEFEACLRFPGSECVQVCGNISAHLSAGSVCFSSEHKTPVIHEDLMNMVLNLNHMVYSGTKTS